MNRTEIEGALRERVPHSCLEWRVRDKGSFELVVHTMDPDEDAETDGAGTHHGPEVIIAPFEANGDPLSFMPDDPELFAFTEDDAGEVVNEEACFELADLIGHVERLVAIERRAHESIGERGRRLRAEVTAAVERAWEGSALSEDWFASIIANLDEPPKDDEVGWAILDREGDPDIAAAPEVTVTPYDQGYLAGMVTKYGREVVVEAARAVEAF